MRAAGTIRSTMTAAGVSRYHRHMATELPAHCVSRSAYLQAATTTSVLEPASDRVAVSNHSAKRCTRTQNMAGEDEMTIASSSGPINAKDAQSLPPAPHSSSRGLRPGGRIASQRKDCVRAKGFTSVVLGLPALPFAPFSLTRLLWEIFLWRSSHSVKCINLNVTNRVKSHAE